MTVATGNAVRRHVRRVALQLDDQPDGRLLDLFLTERDEAAFALLVRRHGPMVFGVCRRVLRNTIDADDAFQATFVVLVRKARELSGRATVGNFLYGVAYHTALKARAMAAKRRRHEQACGEKVVRDTADPGLLEAFDAALAALPDKYREPLVLHELEGLSRKQAAERLGIPEGTLSSRLATAKRMLGDRLTRIGAASAVVPGALATATVQAATSTAGHMGGAVPAVVVQLSSEVLKMMFLSKLKAGFGWLAVLVGVAAALGAATWPGRSDAAPAAEAPARTEPRQAKDQPPVWEKEFNRLYGLADGEILKRVAPPFPTCRAEYAKLNGHLRDDGGFTADDVRMVLKWDGKKAGDGTFSFATRGPTPQTWFTVRSLLDFAAGVSQQEVEGDLALLNMHAVGDFVVRKGATTEMVLPELEKALAKACEAPVKFIVRESERDVVVASGKFKSAPRAGREQNEIDVFSHRPVESSGAGGGSGDLKRFFQMVGDFTNSRIVSEVETGPSGTLSWYFHARSPFTAEMRAEDTNPEAVFKTVTSQTGLKFKTEKRKVRVVEVRHADAKPAGKKLTLQEQLQAEATDLHQLKGTWVRKKKDRNESGGVDRIRFDERKAHVGGMEVMIAVNPTATPKEMNIVGNQTLLLAIYELDGDTLRVAIFGRSEVTRPTGFTKDSARVDGEVLIVWEFQREPVKP